LGSGIGEAQAGTVQPEMSRSDLSPTAMHQLGDLGGPLPAQIESGSALEFFPGPTGIHPKAKGSHFASPREGRQRLGELLGTTTFFQLLAVENRIGPIA